MGISFPGIAAPQQATQRKSDLDGLAELMLALTQARTQRAQFREQMALQRQQEERAAAESGERRQQNKEQAAREKAKFEQEERQNEADDIIGNTLPGVLTLNGGKPTLADFENLRATTIAKNPKLAGEINNAFNRQVRELQESAKSYLQRASAETELDVATQTKDARITNIKADSERAVTEAERAGVELRTARVNESLARMSLTNDAGRMNTFQRYLENGVPAGEAARLSLVSLPKGVPADYVLPSVREARGAEGAKAEALGSQAQLGIELIAAAGNKPIGLKADLFRESQSSTGFVGTLTKHLINPRISPEERQTVQGYMLLGQAYTVHVTGATATERQTTVFSNTLIPLDSDDPSTQGKKLTVLRLLPDLIARNLKPAEIAARMAQEAKRIGMTPAQVKLLEAQIPVAQRYQRSPEYLQNVKPAAAGARDGTRGASIPGLDPAVVSRYRTP